jgi:hypothetical protein
LVYFVSFTFMKYPFKSLLLFIILLSSVTAKSKPPRHYAKAKHHETIPAGAKKLIATYPDFITGFADNHLVFKDKTTLLWDDGIKNKSFQDLLDKPDGKDMFIQKYNTGKLKADPQRNFDPGRIRNEDLFLKMYGETADKVKENLTIITWCPNLVGKKVRVTKINGVDQKLKQVSDELDKHPELQKYLADIGGTFNWRVIHGTTRHSTHSFGMTIDINTNDSDYWQWNCKCTNEDVRVDYKNKIPPIIVDIFEKYGFIWGGKWYHYDTMHFEYRPELL